MSGDQSLDKKSINKKKTIIISDESKQDSFETSSFNSAIHGNTEQRKPKRNEKINEDIPTLRPDIDSQRTSADLVSICSF